MSKKAASAKVETPADVSLLEGRVLIFAPTGNDAQLTLGFLVKAGLSAQAFREVPQLCEEVARGCGVIVLAEEVLAQSSILILVEALSTQPSWSDIPIVLITSGGEVNQTRLRRLNIFGPGGNVIVLERPFRPATLVSTVEVALRSRQRQYETRKLVEDLHEARAHMEAALGVADIATWTWDLQSDLVRGDKNMLRMFSLAPEDAENCPVEKYFEKVHPDDVAPVQAAIDAARQSESGDYEADYRVIQAGGAVRWVTSRGRVEKDAAGKPALFLGVNIDITERKRAEQALRASEEFNRSLMDGSVDCVKVLDLEGRLLAMNEPGMCVMEIDDFSSVCNRQWWELWPDETRPEIMQAIAFAGEGRPSNFQAFCPTAKGTPKWWEVSVSAVRDRTGGQVVRLLSVSRDITERKRTEAVLLIQKQTFEMAASGAPLMEVLQMLAAGIEQHTEQQPMVAIHLLDETGTRFTRTAGAGLPAGYAEAVDGMLVDSMTGPCCAAIVRRHRVAVADVANDTEFPQFAAFAVPAGIRAGWSMPILSSQGAVIGTVAHYYRQPHAFRAGDDVLAQIVSRTASLVIERKQAEAALRASEERHRALFDSTVMAIFVCDREGVIQDYNRRAAELWGREPKRGVEKQCGSTKLFLPDGTPLLHEKSPIMDVLRTGEPAMNVEVLIEQPDGVQVPVIVSFAALKDCDGQITGAMASFNEIIERKKNEQLIAGQNEVLQAVAAGKPLKEILELATTGVERQLPGSMASVLTADAEGKHLFSGSVKSLPAEFNAAIEGIAIGEGVGSCGTAASRRKPVFVSDIANDPLWKDYRAFAEKHQLRACWSHPIFSPDEKLLGTFAIYFRYPRAPREGEQALMASAARIAGIAIERKRFEEALRESEANFRALLNASNEVIYRHNADWSQMMQLRGGGFLADTESADPDWFNRYIHPDDQPHVWAEIEKAIKTKSVFHLEHRVIQADGTLGWTLSRSTPLLDESGEILGWFGAASNVTARRAAEDAVREARDLAETASRAKDDFLAALSHELRTPLNPALLVASEAAADKKLPEEVRQNFETIRKSIELEARLIDDLLDLTRITTGKMVLEKKVVDVHEVLKDALATVQADQLGKKIQIVSDFTDDPALVSGDPVRLEQIFWNILKNAVKFTPANGKVDVRTSRADGNLKITFTDTGIGMKAEEVARVFEAFAQGDHASGGGSHRFGGLGLGLAISKKLVEIHAGKIFAESAGRNLGAVITVELPLAQKIKNKNDSYPDADGTSPVGIPRPDGAQISVLLVEDHDATRTVLAQLLVRRNYKVTHTNTIASARSLAGQNKFDLLISDIGLPDGNGNDLMKEFQDRYGLKGIALTGYGMEEDIERGKAAGFVTHLIKPVRIQSLEKALSVFSKT